MEKKYLQIRWLMIFVLLLFFSYIVLLINFYGLYHLDNDQINYLDINSKKSIPNIVNCNYDYYSINQHMSSGKYENIRFRKIVTTDSNCYGKVIYSNVVPGTKFEDIKFDSYIEFGVTQKLGFALWLFEKNFLIFLLIALFISVLQIFRKNQNLFLYFFILIFIFSIFVFQKHNMFINSSKIYFPNEGTKNSELITEWFKNND